MSESIGCVVSLYISSKELSKRIECMNVAVDVNGVIGDKFYGKNAERSILLASTSSYDLVLEKDIEMSYGALGENILIDFNPYNLALGSQLKLGEVVIEISQNCTICKSLASIDKDVPELLKDDRGVFIKVIQAGFIEKGDKLYLL